ncbi:MAG: hypothetical protein RIQ56_752 [Candidatus Parcubacteria bacterium]
MSDRYRQAASVLLLRPVEVCSPGGCNEVYQLLLLHKPRKRDAWQMPQGGLEKGETVQEAALRELHEEAGITDCKVIGESSECYQYDFPSSFRRFRPDNVCGQCIHFVFALASKDLTITVDEKEIDAYVWVDVSQLKLYIQREEYRDLVEKMYDEALQILNN